MKLFTQSFKNLFFAALAMVAGRVVAFPVEVTKLTKGEDDNKITIWNVKDWHINDTLDESNATAIIELARQHNATILLECGFLHDNVNDTELKSKLDAIITEDQKTPDKQGLLGKIFFKTRSLLPSIKIVGVETRQSISLTYIPTSWTAWHVFVKTGLNAIYKNFETLAQQEKDTTLKSFYETSLESINKILPNQLEMLDQQMKGVKYMAPERALYASSEPRANLITATYQFTDIKILSELFGRINTKKEKNFIIISGELHGNAIEKPLETMGFKKEILATTVISPATYKECADGGKPTALNLTTIQDFQKGDCTAHSSRVFTLSNLFFAGCAVALITAATKAYGPRLWNWIKSKF